MAHLAREVEDNLAIADEVVHRAFLPDIGDVHADLVGDAVDVEEVCARIRDERIHQEHIGAELDQTPGDVAADETEAARDHHAPAAVEILIRRAHQSTRVLWPAGSVSSTGFRCVCRTTSATQSFITSMPVLKTRRKLKNCDWPCARW